MKTRLEILEKHHEIVFLQLTQEEINHISISRKLLLATSKSKVIELKEIINKIKNKEKELKRILLIVEELIEKEERVKKT